MSNAKQDKPAQTVQLTTNAASPSAKKFFQDCTERSVRPYIGGCPVKVLAHVGKCGGAGAPPARTWEEWPCLIVEDIRPVSVARTVDCATPRNIDDVATCIDCKSPRDHTARILCEDLKLFRARERFAVR